MTSRGQLLLRACAENKRYCIVKILEYDTFRVIDAEEITGKENSELFIVKHNRKDCHAILFHTADKQTIDKLFDDLLKYEIIRKKYANVNSNDKAVQTHNIRAKTKEVGLQTENLAQRSISAYKGLTEEEGLKTCTDNEPEESSIDANEPSIGVRLQPVTTEIDQKSKIMNPEDTTYLDVYEPEMQGRTCTSSVISLDTEYNPEAEERSRGDVEDTTFEGACNTPVYSELTPVPFDDSNSPLQHTQREQILKYAAPGVPGASHFTQYDSSSILLPTEPEGASAFEDDYNVPETPQLDESEIVIEALTTPAAASAAIQSSVTSRTHTPTSLAISSTSSGKRPKKKHFCQYCKRLVTNFKRHITTMHELEDAVVSLKTAATLSDQVTQLRKIMAEGDDMFNKMNPDTPIVRRKTDSAAAAWDTCPSCKMLVSKNHSVQHYRKCNPYTEGLTGQAIRVELIRGELELVDSLSHDMKTKIIPSMRNDSIRKLCETDSSLVLYGNQLCIRLKGESQEKTIRNHLRVVARVTEKTMEIQKQIDGTISSVAQIFDPICYDAFVHAIHIICGFGQAEGEEMKKPTTPHQYGPKVKEMSDYILTELLKQSDPGNTNDPIQVEIKKNIERIKAWQEIYIRDFDKQVASLGRKQADRRTYDTRQLTPSMEDVQKLIDYIQHTTTVSYENLKENFNLEAYKTLSKCLLLRLWIFNRRRVGEVDVLRLNNWLRAKDIDENSDQFRSLSVTEQSFASSFKRLSVKSKLRRPAALLVAKKDLECYNLLISLRGEAKIAKDNIYLFATHDRHMEGTAVMSEFAKKCGAKDWKLLTGTRLRKQLAASLRYLNLTNEDLRLVTEAMGHTEKTHLTHYRAHDAALHAGRVSKLLMAMDDGTIDTYKGKSLEEMNVEVTIENIPRNERLASLNVDVDADGNFIPEPEDDVPSVAQSVPVLRTPSPNREEIGTPFMMATRKRKPPQLDSDPESPDLPTPSHDKEENITPLQMAKRNRKTPPLSTDSTSKEEDSEDTAARGNTPGRKRAFSKRKQHKNMKWSKKLKAALKRQLSEEIENKKCPSTLRVLEAIGALEHEFPEIVNHSPKKVKVVVTNMFKK